jgi:hypothetical protein
MEETAKDKEVNDLGNVGTTNNIKSGHLGRPCPALERGERNELA